MMRLDTLVRTIHESVHAASDALMKKNLELLKLFFENDEGSSASDIYDELRKSQSTMGQKLKPSTVVVQYPIVTNNEIKLHDVHVPLITLVPISMAEITQVTFKTELEVTLENDELIVSFPLNSSSDNQTLPNEDGQNKENLTNTTLEITLKPTTSPQGLLKLVEGYEKALRAQIPG
ncbi:MAG: DUF2589 domain-containing protein [Desulfobacteraceae bacterium]|nr:DUF2589 domain-containing protein [Desulfobacteraceae bacterium]